MSLIISSTTSSQQEVEQAAVAGGEELVSSSGPEASPSQAADGEGTGAKIHQTRNVAASGSGAEEGAEEAQRDLDETKAERQEQYLHPGKTRRKLLSRLSRLSLQNEELVSRLAKYERPQPPTGQQNGDGQPSRTPPVEQQQQPLTAERAAEELARYDAEVIQRHYQQQAAMQQQQVFDDYNKQVEQARAAHEDFDKVVGTSAQIPTVAINAMYEMEDGAEIAYYLAKHSDVREQLLAWNGARGGVQKIMATLDRISENLSGRATVKQRPVSAAPAPIRPVNGNSASRTDADVGKLPYPDYVRWYQQKYGR